MSTLREQAYLKLIERYSALVPDSVERLRFVQLSVRTFGGENPFLRRQRALWKLRSRAVALESLWLASRGATRALGMADALLLRVYRRRRLLWQSGAVTAACLFMILSTWKRPLDPPQPAPGAPAPPGGPALSPPATAAPRPAGDLWLVESAGSSELYSNGLRIFNDFVTHTGPRRYPVFRAQGGDAAAPPLPEWRHEPAGIVFHTTESEVIPLQPANRRLIRRRDEGLLDYVQRRKLYNFVIDRFGRAYRVVPEAECAYHAGHSLWASAGVVYLNLNEAFVAVAFEARTGGDGAGSDSASPDGPLTPAQIYSGRLLTQALLSRSGVAESNCVSHDLVSVNPAQMLIGYHTDWGGAFPYEALGLTNKYNEAIPSIAKFGFSYDAAFLEAVHGRLWPGIRLAEARLERQAAERRISVERYRRQLQQDYRRWSAPSRTPAHSPDGRS